MMDSYAKMKLPGSSSRAEYYIHHLVLRSKGETTDALSQVSHLCHHPRCIIPEHIIKESPEVNRSRKPCRAVGLLTVTCECGTTFTVSPCKHTPPCILA